MDNKFGWFATVLVITSLLGAISWFCMNGLVANVTKVDRSYQTIQVIQDILTGVVDVENGTRGYLISKDERLLTPFTKGKQLQEESLANLRVLAAEDPGQATRLILLEPQIKNVVQLCTNSVDLKRQAFDTGSATIKSGETRVSMEVVRNLLTEMREHEKEKLKKINNSSASEAYTRLFLGMGFLIGYASILAFVIPAIQNRSKK